MCHRLCNENKMGSIQRRNHLSEDDFEPEVLIRAHFHGYDEGECKDCSGNHTTAWVRLSLLTDAEDVPEAIKIGVKKFMNQTFNMLDDRFDLQSPESPPAS